MNTAMKNYVRTEPDISKIIHHAKLNEDTLMPVTQAIYFADITKQYRLLELDQELITKLKSGIELTFRGNKDDKAVLCSDNKTYEVKEAETSNSLILIPNLKFPNEVSSEEKILEHHEVVGVFHTYLEVKPCKPKLQRLRKLLEPSSYKGSELEPELEESGVKKYSTQELLNIIQASEVELKKALTEIFAFELNDKWRILQPDYHFRVLTYFLNLIDEQSWKRDQIPVNETIELLQDIVPSYILQNLISVYTEDLPDSTSDTRRVKLIEERVCRIFGESLLKPTLQFELTDFLKVWQDTVPEGLRTNLDQLDGLLYITNNAYQKVINYCPEYELSEDIAERIQYLFTLKDKWTYAEIKPYIQIFATEKTNENTILMKYARVSNNNGVRLYSNRHGK